MFLALVVFVLFAGAGVTDYCQKTHGPDVCRGWTAEEHEAYELQRGDSHDNDNSNESSSTTSSGGATGGTPGGGPGGSPGSGI